jgi:hypothetical protein
MVVSILVPTGYLEPSPKEYLQLVITGRKAVTQGNDSYSKLNKCIALGFQQIVFGVYTQDDKYILLVEETGVPGGNHSPVASH